MCAYTHRLHIEPPTEDLLSHMATTLLNTLFEHPNCISIKPFYYVDKEEKDHYLDIVQNISRNFTDAKKMRDRVVNKTYCQPLPKLSIEQEANDE